MDIKVKVKNIETIHTGGDGISDQPMVEVTLELDDGKKSELKFTEMLCNVPPDQTPEECKEWFKELATAYCKTVYLGEKQIDADSKDWVKKSQLINKKFTLKI